MITVQPWLELDDQKISCGALDIGITPVFMDGVSITWGRSGYYDDADPAQMTCRMWDSTGDWAVKIRDGRALGLHVRLAWRALSLIHI